MWWVGQTFSEGDGGDVKDEPSDVENIITVGVKDIITVGMSGGKNVANGVKDDSSATNPKSGDDKMTATNPKSDDVTASAVQSGSDKMTGCQLGRSNGLTMTDSTLTTTNPDDSDKIFAPTESKALSPTRQEPKTAIGGSEADRENAFKSVAIPLWDKIKKIDQLRVSLHQAKIENGQLKKDNEHFYRKIKDLVKENADLKKQKDDIMFENEELNKKMETLGLWEKDELYTKINSLKKQKALMEDEIAILKGNNRFLQMQASRPEDDLLLKHINSESWKSPKRNNTTGRDSPKRKNMPGINMPVINMPGCMMPSFQKKGTTTESDTCHESETPLSVTIHTGESESSDSSEIGASLQSIPAGDKPRERPFQ